MKAEPIIDEVYALRFQNEEHRRWHHLLIGHDFEFSVYRFCVGMVYKHPGKNVLVTLEESGEAPPSAFYDCKVQLHRIRNDKPEYFVPMNDYYSEMEWRWICDTSIDAFKCLERELHVLLKVRPNTMNSVVLALASSATE